MRVVGLDISLVGLRDARESYGHLGIEFVVGDVLALPFRGKFDCVFVRSLSLYNTERFVKDRQVTSLLLEQVRPGGTLIFLYNANLARVGEDSQWRHHSMQDVMDHFNLFMLHELYFLSKLDCVLLGRWALSRYFTALNVWLSRKFSVGGEFVAIIGKP